MALEVSGNLSTSKDGVSIALSSAGQGSTFNSMEQIFSPIQINKGHNGPTPGFRQPAVLDEQDNQVHYGGNSVSPTVSVLDPYFPQIDGGDGSVAFQQNDFRVVLHDIGQDYNLKKFESLGFSKAQINAVRTNALRGPLIMSGWGYNVCDKPVPADGTGKAHSGGTMKDRGLWRTGPVHIPWDEERQVWATQHRIVYGVALTAIRAPANVCTPTTFRVGLMRNTLGKIEEEGEQITVVNRDPSLEQDYYENAIFVMAIKLNYEWLPLWVGCPEEPACGCEDQPPKPECVIDRCAPCL